MKHFYLCPTALLAANPPTGGWHSTAAPGAPAVSVVVVEHWQDHDSQDAWEALPGTFELLPEMLGVVAPPNVITAFAPWGATTGMTLRQVFQVVRQTWRVFRH